VTINTPSAITPINIGIVAHVDAGKTSLTERILYETGVISEIGRVDRGTTQTDSLELEKRRGITIKASVVSFFINDRKINLVDTPGHADFLAEVERSLSVLDAAILVISAVEGVQPQTRTLYAALSKLRIPTIIFINKIDRLGAQSDALLQRIERKLGAHVIAFTTPERLGTRAACVTQRDLRDPMFRRVCVEVLALGDERLLAAFVEGAPVTERQARVALARQVGDAELSPVFFGSAITGAGVGELLAQLGGLLPAPAGQEDAPLSATVFKLEREATGEKVAYVRIYAGSLRAKTVVALQRRAADSAITTHTGKVHGLRVFVQGKTAPAQQVGAGEFCKVWGLKDARVGDVAGAWSEAIKTLRFATPRMEASVAARRPEQRHALYQALLELAEEDPLIAVIHDPARQTLALRLFGEVQREVIETTLTERFGLEVEFGGLAAVCVEKPRGVGRAVELMGAPGNPFKAAVGFRVDPGPVGSGVTYTIIPGALPLHFHKTIEETARATLAQGLYGWEVTDIAVTLTQTGYNSHRDDGTKRLDFTNLVPLVLMAALAQAGTEVYEPVNQFELSAPVQALSATMFKLAALGATYGQPLLRDDEFLLTGALPVATTGAFRAALPGLTEGEGVFLVQGGGYRKAPGIYPTCRRTDLNPLNRGEYLLRVHRAL
jgi:ribosomal protection tetracycline resistance protein